MKAIVSTKVLKGFSKLASLQKCSKIRVFGNTITALSLTEDESETAYVHPIAERDLFECHTDHSQWYRVYLFLKSLEEQPIVVEISQIGDNEIKIEFSQFIARF